MGQSVCGVPALRGGASVRASWVRAVMALALTAAFACGGDDDDGSAGRSGAGASGGGVAGKGSAGSAPAGTGGGGMKVFDAGSADDRNDVTAGEICQRVADILCAGEAFCCDDPGRDVAACQTAMLKTCNNSYMLDTIAMDPRVGFDPAGASAAFTMLEERAKACDPSVSAWAVSSEGFVMGLDGTLNAGDDCEPMGGAENASVAELLTALASCSTSAGLACLPSPDGWKCAPRSSAGGKCATDGNCADGMYCVNTSEELDGSGTCTARKAAGMTCTDATECASFICTSGKCAAVDDKQAAYCLD